MLRGEELNSVMEQSPRLAQALADGLGVPIGALRKLGEQGMYYANQIKEELDRPPADWLVLERDYNTQSVDTAAMEPDNANCWYDAAAQTLHMVVRILYQIQQQLQSTLLLLHYKLIT